MKMTMHIDEKLLKAAMKATGAESKTAAVAEALRRVTLKARQKAVWAIGLDATPGEIAAGFDANLALGLKPAKARAAR